jgi:hypothetical protein
VEFSACPPGAEFVEIALARVAPLVRRRDGAAILPGLHAPRLDELLEALEIPLDATAQHAEPVADVLGRALRVVIELERDTRFEIREPVERDDARVAGSRRAPPGDPLVGDLLRDLRIPLERLYQGRRRIA